MKFFSEESCGQCTPCRVGTAKALQLMEQKRWDAPLLKELSQAMVDASICGLGQAAPNPALCRLEIFSGGNRVKSAEQYRPPVSGLPRHACEHGTRRSRSC